MSLQLQQPRLAIQSELASRSFFGQNSWSVVSAVGGRPLACLTGGKGRLSLKSTGGTLHFETNEEEGTTFIMRLRHALRDVLYIVNRIVDCHYRSLRSVSYLECMAGTTGLEPAASAVTEVL